MHRQYFVHAFDFDHGLAVCNYIHTVTTIKLNAFIFHWERFLPLKRNFLQPQFMTITGRFQQTRTKMPVDFDSTGDQLFC